MTQKFYTLEEMVSRFGVDADVFIQAWIDKRLPLYIYFQNLPCTIRRCVSAEVHECGKMDIQFGRDYYQSKDSPIHDVMMFVPEDQLSAHFKVRHRFEMGGGDGPRLGEYYEYRYRGYANGYWLAQPTRVTHLSRGKYLLTDKESIECIQSSLGDVTIHAFELSDYLVFSEPVYIERLSLLAKVEDVKELYPENKNDGVQPSGQKPDLMKPAAFVSHLTPDVIFALYLIIQAWCPKNKQNEPILSKVVDYLSSVYKPSQKPSPKLGTIKRWAKKPLLESSIQKREREGQREALYFLIQVYCDEKKIKKSPVKVANLLNELLLSEGYDSEPTFNQEVVSVWLQRPYWASKTKNGR
ncbi:hypothetical protein S675_004096 [Salmonella enterica subsp. enterica]|nr:hypothetical protein [Salmonella enterica subsp. enterica]